MNAAAQVVFEYRAGEGRVHMVPRLLLGIVCQQEVDLPPEQGSDRAAGHWRWCGLPPKGVEACFIGRVVKTIDHGDADIEVVMRNDMRYFHAHGLDGRAKIELSRQEPGYAEIVIEQR